MREKITLFGAGSFGKVHAKDPADLNGKPMDRHLLYVYRVLRW